MGANLRTHFLPHSSIEQVEPAISAWLSAKGFEPLQRPPSVWVQHLSGRGIVLAENDRGVTVAYNEAWSEGDRLIFELCRLGPALLECWLHDSDIWGYKLYRGSEVVASFCSNPRYFGSESHDEDAIRLGRNGDAKLLTETLGIPEQEQALRELQVKRRVFAERPTDAFAELIGASALAMDYLDWQEHGIHAFAEETRYIAGHRVRSIVYVPRIERNEGSKERNEGSKERNEGSKERSEGSKGRSEGRNEPVERSWDLHRVPARPFVQPGGEGFGGPFEITEGMLWTIAVMRAIALPTGLALRAAMLPILLVARFRPNWILGWYGRSSSMENVSPFRKALWEAAKAEADDPAQARSRTFVQDGDAYVHAGYGVRLVPAPGVTLDESSPHSDLCILRVGDQVGMLSVRDFDSTETLLGNLPGEVVEDLHETTADGLPLRFVAAEMALAEPVIRLHREQMARQARASRGWFGGWFSRGDGSPPPPSSSAPEEPASPPRLFLTIVQEERFVYLLTFTLHDSTLHGRASEAAEALKATMRSFRRVSS